MELNWIEWINLRDDELGKYYFSNTPPMVSL